MIRGSSDGSKIKVNLTNALTGRSCMEGRLVRPLIALIQLQRCVNPAGLLLNRGYTP
jgi:hypothetical protein